MTTPRHSGLLLAAVLLASCSGPAAGAGSTSVGPEQRALAAYESFWSVSQAAFASPASRDWAADLAAVATGSALEATLTEVRSYAEFPAHTVGAVSRSPAVSNVTDVRINVVDCVDLGDSRLVADRTGEVLDDLANRVQRYRYRAEIVAKRDQWLVDRIEASLDEPC
ncbi:hypothetical protein [Pseudonocardia sp. GCM10023141]|uniref:hypothetical protein n=1 Tax=Pseudonocardia sp. GCM10023141 TaxID=3252653 RepID=UPI003620AB5F